MLIQFHVLQIDDKTGKTRFEPIFTQEWGFIKVGQTFSFVGVVYRVESLKWVDEDAGILNAYCLVFRDENDNLEIET